MALFPAGDQGSADDDQQEQDSWLENKSFRGNPALEAPKREDRNEEGPQDKSPEREEEERGFSDTVNPAERAKEPKQQHRSKRKRKTEEQGAKKLRSIVREEREEGPSQMSLERGGLKEILTSEWVAERPTGETKTGYFFDSRGDQENAALNQLHKVRVLHLLLAFHVFPTLPTRKRAFLRPGGQT